MNKEQLDVECCILQSKLLLCYVMQMLNELENEKKSITIDKANKYKQISKSINQEMFVIRNLTNVKTRYSRINELFTSVVNGIDQAKKS